MAYTRYNGMVVPFASESTSTNRTIFGDTTQSDDINSNLNEDYKLGWQVVSSGDNPPKQWFNAVNYTLSSLIAYLYQQGVAGWNASQEYLAGSMAMGSNGNIYRAKTGTSASPNINKNPTTDTTNWEQIATINSNVATATKLQTARTINGVSFDGSANITVSDSTAVNLTGKQTIAEVKTFTSSPIVPTPTTTTQAANKEYVDSIISNIQALPIGAILNGYTIFGNCVVAFGGEFNRADYPKLWAYLQANPTLVKTQAQWQTEATANGGICGFFSSGNDTTTFRVPNLDGSTPKFTSRGVGSYEADQVKQHRHTYTTFTTESAAGGSNRVSNDVTTTSYTSYFGGVENTVKNIAFLPLIVAK